MDHLNLIKIYQQYYKKSFLFVKSYIHDEMASEDIVSEVLIKFCGEMKQRKIDFSLPLLLTMLKNKCLDHIKHEKIKHEVLNDLSKVDQRELDFRINTLQAFDAETIYCSDVQEIVEKTLLNFPKQTRDIFRFSRYENKSNKEIAELYGLSTKGIEYHLTKVLKSLRINLKDYLPVSIILFFN